MVMAMEMSVYFVTVLRLLAQSQNMRIYPTSERMGKQRILEVPFHVSEVQRTVTFLIKRAAFKAQSRTSLSSLSLHHLCLIGYYGIS